MSKNLIRRDTATHIVYNPETREYELISLEDGEVVNSSALASGVQRFVFNAEIALLICQEVRLGRTLTQIGEDPRFPPYDVISHWKRMHPLFDEHIKMARKDRAEGYHDKVLRLADELARAPQSKEDIAAKKIAIDAYKWGAEKGDPEAFGKKQEITHQNTAPTQIVVHTGIVRKPDVVVEANITEEP